MIEDKVFSIEYELEVLSEIVSNGHVERWVKGFIDKKIEEEHLARYQYALNFVPNKTVLDVAGGSGYGSYILSKEGNASKVISIEIDMEAVKYAEIKYPLKNIERLCKDALKIDFQEEFDVIVSFETIEHLDDYEIFIDKIYNSLKSGGDLFISTPITETTTTNCINKYHKIEWSFYDFQKLMSDRFEIIDTFFQSVYLKEDLKVSKIKRIIRFLFNKPYIPREKSTFEKYINQYNIDSIVSGYQMIHCRKK